MQDIVVPMGGGIASYMNKFMKRIITFAMILVFLCQDAALAGLLQVSSAFDGDLRNNRTKDAMVESCRAKTGRDGFIQSREGKAPKEIQEIRSGRREFLKQIGIQEFGKIRDYIQSKISALEASGGREEYLTHARKGLELLEKIHRQKKIYSFKAIVYNKEDYALGFGNEEEMGIAEELLNIPMELLAEFLFHEAICFKTGHWVARDIQSALFKDNYDEKDRRKVSRLKIILREFINKKARTKDGIDPFDTIMALISETENMELIYIDEDDYPRGKLSDIWKYLIKNMAEQKKHYIFTGDIDFCPKFVFMMSHINWLIERIARKQFENVLKVVVNKEHGVCGVTGIPEELNEKIKAMLPEGEPTKIVNLAPLFIMIYLYMSGCAPAEKVITEFIQNDRVYFSYEDFIAFVEHYKGRKKEIVEHDEFGLKLREGSMVIAHLLNLCSPEDLKRYLRQYILAAQEINDDLIELLSNIIVSSEIPEGSLEKIKLTGLAWEIYLDSENASGENEVLQRFLLAVIHNAYNGIMNAISKIQDIFKSDKINECYKAIDVCLRLRVSKDDMDWFYDLSKNSSYKKRVLAAYALANITLQGVKEKEMSRVVLRTELNPIFYLFAPESLYIYFYILHLQEAISRGGGLNLDVDSRIILLTRALDNYAAVAGEEGYSWFTFLRRTVHNNASSDDLKTVCKLLRYWKEGNLESVEQDSLIQEIPDYFKGDVRARFSEIINETLGILKIEGHIQSLEGDNFLNEFNRIGEEVVLDALKYAGADILEERIKGLIDEQDIQRAREEHEDILGKVQYTISLFYAMTERYGVVLANVIPNIKGEIGEEAYGKRAFNREKMVLRTEFMRQDYDCLVEVLEKDNDQLVLNRVAQVRLRIRDHLLYGKAQNGEWESAEQIKNRLLDLDYNLYIFGKERVIRLLNKIEECKSMKDLAGSIDSLSAIGKFMVSSGLGGVEFFQLVLELEKGNLTYSQIHDLARALRSEAHKITRGINEDMRNGTEHIWDNIKYRDLTKQWQKVAEVKEVKNKWGDTNYVLTEEGKQEIIDTIIDTMIRDTQILSFDQALMRFNEILEEQLTNMSDAVAAQREEDKEVVIQEQFFRFGQPEIIPRDKLLSLWSKKGLNLVKMTEEGMPVPPGVILSARLITKPDIFRSQPFCAELEKEIALIRKYSQYPDLKFLLYARSGSAFTLPGLLTTIPNLGMNDKEAEDLAQKTGDLWFAYDTYAEFIRSYAIHILGIPEEEFQDVLNVYNKDRLTGEEMKAKVEEYKEILKKRNKVIPEEMIDQVMFAIDAVYASWDSDDARAYRERHRISQEWGTVVILQKGLFGNLSITEDRKVSGAGFGSLRFLPDGSEVVQGKLRFRSMGDQLMSRADQNYVLLSNSQRLADEQTLEELQPEIYNEILKQAHRLKTIFGNNQQFEFVVELNKVWITQSNDDYVTIDYSEFVDIEGYTVIGRGHGVSAGAFRGWAANSIEKAGELIKLYETYSREKPQEVSGVDGVILFIDRVNPELVNRIPKGVAICAKVISVHAETLAQKSGIPSVYGVNGMEYNESEKAWYINGRKMTDREVISIDGHENQLVYHNSGRIFLGSIPLVQSKDGMSEVERRTPRALDLIRKLRQQELDEEAFARGTISLTRFEKEIIDAFKKYIQKKIDKQIIDRYRHNYEQILDKIALFCKNIDFKLYGKEFKKSLTGCLAGLGIDFDIFMELYKTYNPKGRKAKTFLDLIISRLNYKPEEHKVTEDITIYTPDGKSAILKLDDLLNGRIPIAGNVFIIHPLKKKPRLVSFDIDDVLQQLLSEDMKDVIELFKRLKALDIKVAVTSANPDVLRWFNAVRDYHHELAGLIDYCEYTESHIRLDQYVNRPSIGKDEIIHFGNCWVGDFNCPSVFSLHEQGFVSVAVDQRLMYRTENIMNKKVDAVVFGRLTIKNVLDIVELYRFSTTPPDDTSSEDGERFREGVKAGGFRQTEDEVTLAERDFIDHFEEDCMFKNVAELEKIVPEVVFPHIVNMPGYLVRGMRVSAQMLRDILLNGLQKSISEGSMAFSYTSDIAEAYAFCPNDKNPLCPNNNFYSIVVKVKREDAGDLFDAGVMVFVDEDIPPDKLKIYVYDKTENMKYFVPLGNRTRRFLIDAECLKKSGHPDTTKNVSCGTICESGHKGAYWALYEQLKRQFDKLKIILGITGDRDLTEEEADKALVLYAGRFGIKISYELLQEYRKQIKETDNAFKQVCIFFSIPETNTGLFWVKDTEKGEWTYAGGHFSKKHKRIHISLPIVLNRGIEAGIAIARHDLTHIQKDIHSEDDYGMQIVHEIAKNEKGMIVKSHEMIPINKEFMIPPEVLCPLEGGEIQVLNVLHSADIGSISFLLGTDNGRIWLSFAIKKFLTVLPTEALVGLFLIVTNSPEGNEFLKLFYDTLESIDPAKAGLIILYFLGECRDRIDNKSASRLDGILNNIVSSYQLDKRDIFFIRAFFYATLRNRFFLRQFGISEVNEDTCVLVNSEMGPVFEIRGDSPENISRYILEGICPPHLEFYFPEDIIPYLEDFLRLEGFTVPFRDAIESGIRKMKETVDFEKSDLTMQELGSLYGYIISRSDKNYDLEEYIKIQIDEDASGYSFLLQEAIIIVHNGIGIFLIPDLEQLGLPGSNARRTPYRVVGFVLNNRVYPLERKGCKRIEKYISTLSPFEVRHYLCLRDNMTLNKRDTFLKLATAKRGLIYYTHDNALRNEVAKDISGRKGPISLVDVGMGNGELLHKLYEYFSEDNRLHFFGAEPDERLLRCARALLPGDIKLSGVAGENLSQAEFSGDLTGTYKIALLEGVIAARVTESKKGREILEEILRIGFDRIYITGNTPVNLHYEEIKDILQQFGYELERTLYPQNLFNYNKPRIMFVINKVKQNPPTPCEARACTPLPGGERILELEKGTVERPAVYEYDEEFWRKVEESNPGTLEKVKRIIATYFDTPSERRDLGLDPEKCLTKDVDYDFISGRSVIVKLNSPVEINGVVMKEIIIKGAPFKKSEKDKQYYPIGKPTEEQIRHLKETQGHIEFDSNGCGKVVRLYFCRKDARFYHATKDEYDLGRKESKDDKCPVNILPVMCARYLEDKAPDGGELGVVVIASPSKTVHFVDWAINRVGHLVTILLGRLEDSRSQSDAKEIEKQIYTRVGGMMGAYGLALRKFHDAGYTHGNPHPANVVCDIDTDEVHIVDLSETRIKSEMTFKQTFGYQLRDIHYATSQFTRGINKPHVPNFTVMFVAHALRCFLINYFGSYGEQFRSTNDYEILNYVNDLDVFFATKYHPDNPGSKLIYTDEVLSVLLAHLVSRVVSEAGGFRGEEQTSADADTSGSRQSSKELDLNAPIDTETLLHSLHLEVFCGQEPKMDVVRLLAKAVNNYKYDRKIIYRALLDYAEQNNGEPPSWTSVNWIVDRMAQLHGDSTDASHPTPANSMQLLIREDLMDEAGNRLWRENEWTMEELRTSGLPNFVINIGQDGITFANSFKDVLSSVFGLGTEKIDSVAQLVSKIVNARQKAWVKDVIAKSFTMYVVPQSPSVTGDCENNGAGYVNLRVVNELVKGVQDDEVRLKLLSIYLGIFISHDISGHEMGIDNKQYLTMIDAFCFITFLLKEIPRVSIMSVTDVFESVFDIQKSLFIQYFYEYQYIYQQDLTLLSNIGIKKGDNIITVGMLNFTVLAQKIMEIGAHCKGFEISKKCCNEVRDAISWARENGCEGAGEQICGEFSYGSQFSAGILDHSIDYVLMTTGILSDPLPESDPVSVLKEALRVIKNGGKIVAGSFNASWRSEKGKQQRIIDQVLNLPEYENKIRLVETGEGSYINTRYKIYTVEFVDDIGRGGTDDDRTVSEQAGAKPSEVAKQVDEGKIPTLTHEMFRQWIERGKFKAKYRYEWQIDYPSIAITSDGRVVGLVYDKNKKEWHVSFNGIGVFYVTTNGKIELSPSPFPLPIGERIKVRGASKRKFLYNKFTYIEDYEYVLIFIEAIENAIRNPRETRRRIADFYIERRRQLKVDQARDKKMIEKRGCIEGLPIHIQDESELINIADENLHMYLLSSIYETVDGEIFSLIYESVLNETLRRRGYVGILENCVKWAKDNITTLGKNDLWQTCLNVLDSAIERAGSIEQRTAITRLKGSYLSNIGKTKPHANIMVDMFLSTIRAKAQSCKDLDEELVLAIDTDIGNLGVLAMELFTALNQLRDAYNVRIFIGSGAEVETQLKGYLAEKGDKKDFVISAVVKDENVTLFNDIKDRMQITVVNDRFLNNSENDRLNYIPILSIIELAIKKAMGGASDKISEEYSNIPNVDEIYERDGMLIISLFPKSKPIPVGELEKRYEYEAQALSSA